MSRYQKYGVSISESQKDKIKSAIQNGEAVSIRLKHEDLQGDDVLALTNSQLNKIGKAHQEGKGVTIKLSKAQLQANIKVEGGFLAALARLALPLAARALPAVGKALGIGALTGLANEAVGSLFGGSGVGEGLYLKKGGYLCQIESDGKGLYLSPTGTSSGGSLMPQGDGLYLGMKGRYCPVGKGLILGPNSPFKNIPFLNILL